MEDSDIFADVLLEFLAESGYKTLRAENGFEGIKLAYSFMPHLIITDIEMPIFKGYQATRLLKSRKSTKDIPVIMFTSLKETKDRFWGESAGADFYIEKSPENFSKLRDSIIHLLGGCAEIDFAGIEREGKRINDNAIIEMVNNLLDNKLFQTTIVGMLAELSSRMNSMEEIVQSVLELLRNVVETEIVSVMIQGGALYVYTANFSGYSRTVIDDFNSICKTDFGAMFPDSQTAVKSAKDFFQPGSKDKQIESYIVVPLHNAGKQFASMHIGNSIRDYFTPGILENLNVFLAAAAPIIANALYIREMDELQKRTRTAFARYVPEDVMDEIIRKSSSGTVTQSETRNVTVLFSDIRNFTKITEKTGAQEVVSFLNNIFAAMGTEIISEMGHIDKFIGDAIMAVFGVSKTIENAPQSAIRAAVRMLAALKTVDTSAINLPDSGLRIGIGINCGECIVGNIGFENKIDYTLIGNTVNLASRLEGTSKMYQHPLIVSSDMYNAARDNFIFRKIDNARVKGKDEPVEIYAVYTGFEGEEAIFRDGKKSDLPIVPELLIKRELLNDYNNGIRLHYMKEWKASIEYFEKAVEADPHDFLANLYLDRSREYLRNPPPEDWDGSVTLTEK
jgi:class 3 adenylate cyclase/DNA-binding response OmpR family regulator